MDEWINLSEQKWVNLSERYRTETEVFEEVENDIKSSGKSQIYQAVAYLAHNKI